jgi:hypothetical protein
VYTIAPSVDEVLDKRDDRSVSRLFARLRPGRPLLSSLAWIEQQFCEGSIDPGVLESRLDQKARRRREHSIDHVIYTAV